MLRDPDSCITLYITLALGVLIFVMVFCLYIFTTPTSYSDIILAITALVLLLYTYETYNVAVASKENVELTRPIAEVNEENLELLRKPTINYMVYTHPEDKFGTMFQLKNSSNHPVAVKINCGFKINNQPINGFPDYSGEKYWNLQYKQTKIGHFSFLYLLYKGGIISLNVYNEILGITAPDSEHRYWYAMNRLIEELDSDLDSLNTSYNLTMDVDIYCQIRFNDSINDSYYPPVHYDYDYKRIRWIPRITSPSPYWEYNSRPDWISR